jgi:hypothetical protein
VEVDVMDGDVVRVRATEFCDALVAGDVDRASRTMSDELRRKLGEILTLMPLPASEATVESVDHSGSGYNVVVRLVGETDEVEVQTRWKDRDGEPTMVEASHVSQAARPVGADETREDAEEPAGAA